MPSSSPWTLPLGATVARGGVQFRVWAPASRRVDVVLEDGGGRSVSLQRRASGYFSGVFPGLRAGALYRYRLNRGPRYPDPCSRYQPQGPHGPSQVVDPSAYRWHDRRWRGVRLRGQVVYELHVGTFTSEGTLDAAAAQLPELKRLGVTLIELMPLAEFPGRWNWGYDGVDLYAPAHVYGDPDALRRFVDQAHQLGLGVLLDVVYNHFGPDGNYLAAYSDSYLTTRHATDWGAAVNFDGPGAGPVREFFRQNACYWVVEFHLDGLRLDATQDIHDTSRLHILADLSQRVRAAAGARRVLLVAEDDRQEMRLIAPRAAGGYGLDALWIDDFHHLNRVALTGRREAYCRDYCGAAQEFISVVKQGSLYQGQWGAWHGKPRGSPVTGETAAAFIFYLQNHDQVANQLGGLRLPALANPAQYRALSALLLLAPETPLLFMGQEFAASSPFLFFSDHEPALQARVSAGRRKFLARFPSAATPEAQRRIPDPGDPAAFQRSKLDLAERHTHAPIYRLHQDLLRLRWRDPVIAAQAWERVDGAVLTEAAFVLRWFGRRDRDRLLVVNLGRDVDRVCEAEPLLAPVRGGRWRLIWSSDDPRYGGPGVRTPCLNPGWALPAMSAVLLSA